MDVSSAVMPGSLITSPIAEAAAILRSGRSVLLDGSRSVAVAAAEVVTDDVVDDALRHSGGVVEVWMDAAVADAIGLGLAETTAGSVARMVGIELRDAAGDPSPAALARTARALAHEDTSRRDFIQPGRVFPVRVDDGGVLTNPQVVEAAAVDLMRLSGLQPVAVVAHPGHQGSPQVQVSTEDVLRARMAVDGWGEMSGWTNLPTPYGAFRARAVHVSCFFDDALVLAAGRVHELDVDVSISVHVECPLGDPFGSLLCDCRATLQQAMQEVSSAHAGLVIYLKHGVLPAAVQRTGIGAPAERAAMRGLVDGLVAAFRVRRPAVTWHECSAAGPSVLGRGLSSSRALRWRGPVGADQR